MIPVFSGENANEAWTKAAEMLFNVTNNSASRCGDSYELLHAVFTIDNPRQRWIPFRNPPISISFALAEVIWILNGSNNADIINFWNPALKQFAGNSNHYHGAYGYRIRKRYGIDQLERAYNALRSNPENRQTVMLIWNPEDDLPDISGKPADADIPCNICSLLKVRNSKLEWMQIVRSNDIFLGVPYNFIQFTTLQEILAGWLGLELGSYSQLSDSLHLYKKDKTAMSIKNKSIITNHDDLTLTKEISDIVFYNIFERMKKISLGNLNEKKLKSLSYLQSGYEAYDNIMFIISAYAARRYNYRELMFQLVHNCSNELFRQLWIEWVDYHK